MKVDSLQAGAYTVPTPTPEADGTATWSSTTMVLVQARAGDSVGLGWTYGPAAAVNIVEGELASVVAGRSALDVPGSWDAMVKAVRNATRQGLVGYAISAVDVALWDLKAQLLDLPLHRLFGVVRDRVPVYGSGGFTTFTDEQLTEHIEGWMEQDLPRIKIKIGESWGQDPQRDLRRIRQSRDLIGPEVELFVDANGGYRRKQAVRIGRAAAEEADIVWFEEPVSSDDLDGLHEVRDSVRADVTAGEYGWDLYYFRRMCAANAVDCLQIDATRCGGLTEWHRSAAVAASFGLDVSGHCAPHLHAAAAAATLNFRHLEWFDDHVRIESTFFDGSLDPTGGWIQPHDDRPGLGLTLREPDIERYRVA